MSVESRAARSVRRPSPAGDILRQMSVVKAVAAEFMLLLSVDMAAAKSPAMTSPSTPVGSRVLTNHGRMASPSATERLICPGKWR